MPHVLDLQTLTPPEEDAVALLSTESLVSCPEIPSAISFVLC